MNHLDACAGLGGFALGLQMAGLRFDWQGYSEIDKDCEAVYAKHYPKATRLGDLTRWREWGIAPGWLDIFSCGFPCPPFSVAGKRLGGDDPRNLWPVVAGAIRGLLPRIVLLENVGGLLHGKPGRPAYLGRVLGDLAEAGYDAEWEVLSAREIGASHRRERVFVVAHDNDSRSRTRGPENEQQRSGASCSSREHSGALDDAGRAERRTEAERSRLAGNGQKQGTDSKRQEASRIAESGEAVANTESERLEGRSNWGAGFSEERGGFLFARSSLPLFPPRPTDAEGWRRVLARWPELAPAIGGRLNVRFVEWLMGYPIGWCDGMKRGAALKALGNAVVPQCAAEAIRRMSGARHNSVLS